MREAKWREVQAGCEVAPPVARSRAAGVGIQGADVGARVQNLEIERKFLVRDDSWRAAATDATRIRQAYLRTDAEGSVRVRIRDGRPATLTIKSKAVGMARAEFEYEIPTEDAEQLFALRRGVVIEKVRHAVPWGGHTWEVDVFEGVHEGLVIAEIELQSADQQVDLPSWVGADVTGDQAYYNSVMARAPER